ncbi:hypothetical protein FW774_09325 [Pedobacter sp. BS3]|uniref:hypothetical protein n=1 Tax=Pedobacter sp. BS3 TaxID=2567937 RepID=UPI0011EF4854|nr:hypothetical protein [Pedobacter sp. BS3]TZF83665.1 hypothetical protein FW774_09325 [Pedobacter sp. BS3]
MTEIIRNRTIRPSSRQRQSISYKIDTTKIGAEDILIVNITHENNSFNRTYKFKGSDVAHRNSIHFIVIDPDTSINISWSGAQPIESIINT